VSHTHTLCVAPQVVDYNEAPIVLCPSVAYINENYTVGTEVFRFLTRDEESLAVAHTIEGGNVNGALGPAFSMDIATGVLRFATPIDYETGPKVLNLTLNALDTPRVTYAANLTVFVLTVIIVGA
jgi:hypothetical protein